VYRVPAEKIELIAHGTPDVPFVEPEQAKAKLGFSNRTVILTFGLLSPSKGIEFMIDAMPSILNSCPDAVYVVLGATHPNLGDVGNLIMAALEAPKRARNFVVGLGDDLWNRDPGWVITKGAKGLNVGHG